MTVCRLCQGSLVVDYDFGPVPPANRLRQSAELSEPEPTTPLRFAHCQQCLHAQIVEEVKPDTLFVDRPYLYRSGTSSAWRRHCRSMDLPPGEGRFALDIGSNDGTMVRQMLALDYTALGVEPSTLFTGYPVHHGWWDLETATRLVQVYGLAHVITAMNVFAHVADSRAFLTTCASALHPDGTIVIEVPHLVPMLESGAFDAIYHEHIHYWHLRPLLVLARAVGLDVVSVEPLTVHGGSLRVYLRHAGVMKPDQAVQLLLELESRVTPEAYTQFHERVAQWQMHWTRLLVDLREQGKRIVGYGASAKGNTILCTTPVEDVPLRIIDDNQWKQGWFTPGQVTPIVSMKQLGRPDVVLILAWNVSQDLIAKMRQQGYRGQFVVPFPVIQIV